MCVFRAPLLYFRLLCCYLLVFAAGPLLAQMPDKPHEKYKYLLYLPKDYNKKTVPYPVIIYLHGSSHRGNDLNKLKGYGIPQLIAQGKEFDFIIASPQCPDGKSWGSDNWFDPLYDELKTRYRIDPTRVYLTGISLGGNGTFVAGAAHASKLAALVPLCGWVGENELGQLCQNLKEKPIYTYHGTADTIVDINETERIVKALKACNGNIAFKRLENEGHGIQFLYEKQEIYDCMLQWRLK
ncbi:prolyl oligopeptidase family serine peptidase [Emticicia sp. 21SJ11W-3]|uniref:carboxylesterase family protein n=1 Tax=Emticicia sp. 21SJ11W-3 TaxID=2916755 RepID=UPI00209CA4EA|nr:prolyl oligopeptidase family serine peptidase [Emticicia sp. 21SJ11W-3]UTA66441.1 prolyl oligopeptidase family serine peptidase [Emticicia sp. 21SJ11W-3]